MKLNLVNQDRLNYQLAVMKAWGEGQIIETTGAGRPTWSVVSNPRWDWDHYEYRVAADIPRQFSTLRRALCMSDLLPYSVVWMRHPNSNNAYLATQIGPDAVWIENRVYSYQHLYEAGWLWSADRSCWHLCAVPDLR